MFPDPLPCPNPWCGRQFEPRAILSTGMNSKTPWRVICQDCEQRGPEAKTEIDAIGAWNDRPPIPDA